ncbi:acetate kinase [Clostridia bacterium]|nr:acetate kinase [Clostridia bacterium]
MKILVQNLGSTSFKCKLFNIGDSETELASASVENIGREGTLAARVDAAAHTSRVTCLDHVAALEACLDAMRQIGAECDIAGLDAVAYKAVHGGRLSGAQRVDESLFAEMERVSELAPAHNPIYLRMMRAVGEFYPTLEQVACFETAFHAEIPMYRAVYGAPYEWVERFGIRRYGFHGSSHSYIAWHMQRDYPQMKRIVSAHLGGSSSLCAIADGKSVATSMGATPQSGVFQNNRVGDFDAFCLPLFGAEKGGINAALREISCRGGLLGLSGVSGDMREVIHEMDAGNGRARLAFDAFCDAVVGYVGMYTAFLGGLDALVFTGGIGANSARVRAEVCARLGFIGAQVDESINELCEGGPIHNRNSGIAIFALTTNEELMVARGCAALLRAGS